MRSISFSILRTAKTSVASRQSASLAEFLENFSNEEGYEERPSKDGLCWSPIVWRDDSRASPATPEFMTCLVYDLDWDERPDLAQAVNSLASRLTQENWFFALHETFTANRFRLILPLARDVTPGEYSALLPRVRDVLGISIDESGTDYARLFYAPSKPSGSERLTERGGEQILDPDEPRFVHLPRMPFEPTEKIVRPVPAPPTLDTAPVQLDMEGIRQQIQTNVHKKERRAQLVAATKGELKLARGNREQPLHALVTIFADAVKEAESWGFTEAFFLSVCERMEPVDEPGVDYYMKRVRSSWERAMVERLGKEAARDALMGKPSPQNDFQGDWRQGLRLSKDKVKATAGNIDLILQKHPDLAGHIRFNDLTKTLEVTGGVLAEQNTGDMLDKSLQLWLERSEFEIETGLDVCGTGLLYSGRQNSYDPVKEYLEGLEWDGRSRLAGVLRDYCHAMGNDAYIEMVCKKFFVSAVARSLNPGEKVDTALILHGAQGQKKTSFVATISRGHYTTFSNRIDDKDSLMANTGAWVVELGELSSMQKSSLKQLRSFMTQTFDNIRIPYARSAKRYERRCVFVGTTNDLDPLDDEDGSRRFWVISVNDIDIEGLEKVLDQVWAEAVQYYREYCEDREAGVPADKRRHRWWLTPPEQEISNEENEVYQADNPVQLEVRAWAGKMRMSEELQGPVSAWDVCTKALHVSVLDNAGKDAVRSVAKTLVKLGWKKRGVKFWPPWLTGTEE